MPGSFAAGADGGEMPAVAGAAEKYMPDEEHDDQRGCVDRNSENAAFAQKVPGVAIDRIGGEDGGEALV